MTNSFLIHPELGFDSLFLAGGEVGCVLLHGYTASPVEVKQLADFLHAKGYTISAPLLPGHGTHPDDLNRVQFCDWVQTAEDAVEALKSRCTRVFIGGESLGGLVAMRVAELHPELAGLLLYSPALKAWKIWASCFGKYFIKYIKKATNGNGFIWSGYNVFPLGGLDQLRKLQKVVAKDLAKITQPTLLFMTQADTLVPQTVTNLITKSVSSKIVKAHTYTHSDHCILLDKDRESAFEISLAFISKITES